MKGDDCSLCDEKAIGYEATLQSGFNVCKEHASSRTLKLKPGTKRTINNLLYVKY